MDAFERNLNEALGLTDTLSESQLKALGRTFVPAADLEALLNKNSIKHMIIGAHALGEITREPRATQDVDIIVREADYDKTIELVTKTYGLKAEGNRIKDAAGNVLVDILTDRHPIYKTAMATGLRVPDPEMMAVMKFMSHISPLRRKDKKIQDQADFFNIAGKIKLNRERMLQILQKVCEPFEFEGHAQKISEWLQEAQR